MTDLVKTPSNRRYVVNFQNKEPKNKYDIWLSLNKHDLNGKTVVDSEYLSDKDLVFKIWMNGKWRPILGIPISYIGIIEALKKKINLIPDAVDGQIAVIQQGEDECDQLVGMSLQQLIQTIINGGGIIPIQRANTSNLGGIKADIHNPAIMADGFVEAKFKGAEGPGENDRLYISAREIANSLINLPGGSGFELQLMGPSTRGGAMANEVPINWDVQKYIPVLIRTQNEHMYLSGESILASILYILGNDPTVQLYIAGEGISIDNINNELVISNILADTDSNGGIRAKVLTPPENPTIAFKPVECGFRNRTDVSLPNYGRMYVDAAEIVNSIAEIITTQNVFLEGKGITITPDIINETITWSIWGTNDLSNYDKYLKLNSSGNIVWDTVSGGQTYPALASNTSAGTDCVITAPNKQEGFLRWDGQFVSISTGNTITWSQLWNSGTKIAEISIDGTTTDVYAPNTIYTAGLGITFGNNNSINIDTTGASSGNVLSYNGSGFSWVPQTSYTQKEGVVIDNTNHTIGGMITNNTSTYAARTNVSFRTSLSTVQNPVEGVLMNIDSGNDISLATYSYNEVELVLDGNSIELHFEMQNQLLHMQGRPVYVLLTINGKSGGVVIDVTGADNRRLINVNEAVVAGVSRSELNPLYEKFLITMQFGLVKIEAIESTIASNVEND